MLQHLLLRSCEDLLPEVVDAAGIVVVVVRVVRIGVLGPVVGVDGVGEDGLPDRLDDRLLKMLYVGVGNGAQQHILLAPCVGLSLGDLFISLLGCFGLSDVGGNTSNQHAGEQLKLE